MALLPTPEQIIPLARPLIGLARDLVLSWRRQRRPHEIYLPKQTLILLPVVQPHTLRWTVGGDGQRPATHITGTLQATNTSKFNVRPSGIQLRRPRPAKIVNRSLFTAGDDNMIPAGSIGAIHFSFMVSPIIGTQGLPLNATISILDQFGNKHILRSLMFQYAGPEAPPIARGWEIWKHRRHERPTARV
jgi:hypothetical protein